MKIGIVKPYVVIVILAALLLMFRANLVESIAIWIVMNILIMYGMVWLGKRVTKEIIKGRWVEAHDGDILVQKLMSYVVIMNCVLIVLIVLTKVILKV